MFLPCTERNLQNIFLFVSMGYSRKGAVFSQQRICTASPLSKHAVSAFQISFMQTTFFYLGRFLKKLADDQCSSILLKAVSTISTNYVHTTCYHSSGLTRNWMFNGSLCFIFADTTFLPGTADCHYCVVARQLTQVLHGGIAITLTLV